ncbi:MHJ_0274 family protein [Mycoplasma procyoni]|uniref:MHJ_0274 family protein n=1 Tax=Mycoplasma procyoni TaxID=568784 RepID=UPI00197BB77B|nr:hypothetical protein [Mycoplasma procyoni]MBN3534495.1 hypothetical protein [Mycoplasma procyoni]
MDSTVVLIIMIVVIVALLIGIFLFQYISDRKKRKKIKLEKEKLAKEEKELMLHIVSKANWIIEKNDYKLEHFVVSIGDEKMKDINHWAQQGLKSFFELDGYKRIFVNNPYEKNDLLPEKLNDLITTKSNLWQKRCQDTIKYFKELEELFLSDETDKKQYLEMKEKYE